MFLLSSIIEVVYFHEFHQKPTTLDGDGIVISTAHLMSKQWHVSAISVKYRQKYLKRRLMYRLTKDVLKKIRNDDCFATFYQTVLRKKQLHGSITEFEVPRNKRAPGRFKVGTGTPFFPVTPEQVYRRIYFEALDLIVSSIEERFDQPSFKAYSNMESLLIGVLSLQDVSSQMDYMKENYANDVRTGVNSIKLLHL